jgi:ankyrin repeat protein
MRGAAIISFLLLLASYSAFASDLDDRLHYAAGVGDLEGVKAALEDGGDPDYVEPQQHLSALHLAAMDGYAEVAAVLLKRGANVNIVDKDGDTPLSTAATFDRRDVAEVLIANGADVHRAGAEGWTPLHSAARQHDLSLMKLLLDHGAPINVVNKHHQTPLDVATTAETADFLLARDAQIGDASANLPSGLSAPDKQLFVAAVAGRVEGIRSAVAHGAHVNIRDATGATALMRAVYFGRFDTVAALLEEGAEVDVADPINGTTPLHLAAGQGYPEIIRLLLAHGAFVDAKDRLGETPLVQAANLQTAKTLLRAGANADVPKALCLAAGDGDGKLVELLISYGADATPSRPCIGDTPLLEAISHSKWDVVSILLDHGADPNATEGSESAPLVFAASEGNADAVSRLLAHGARINEKDGSGDTALIAASQEGHKDVVRLLLDNGADVAVKDHNGATALAVARDMDTADLLLANGADVNDLIPEWFGKDGNIDKKQREIFRAVVVGNVKSVTAAWNKDANFRFRNGNTILDAAIVLGRAEMVNWLLAEGADVDARNSAGLSPLQVAATVSGDGDQEIAIMRFVLGHGAGINSADKSGTTALHVAAAVHNKDAVVFLLAQGANPLLRTKAGFTSLQVAQRSEFGTGVVGVETPTDIAKKNATISALRSAMTRQPIP